MLKKIFLPMIIFHALCLIGMEPKIADDLSVDIFSDVRRGKEVNAYITVAKGSLPERFTAKVSGHLLDSSAKYDPAEHDYRIDAEVSNLDGKAAAACGRCRLSKPRNLKGIVSISRNEIDFVNGKASVPITLWCTPGRQGVNIKCNTLTLKLTLTGPDGEKIEGSCVLPFKGSEDKISFEELEARREERAAEKAERRAKEELLASERKEKEYRSKLEKVKSEPIEIVISTRTIIPSRKNTALIMSTSGLVGGYDGAFFASVAKDEQVPGLQASENSPFGPELELKYWVGHEDGTAVPKCPQCFYLDEEKYAETDVKIVKFAAKTIQFINGSTEVPFQLFCASSHVLDNREKLWLHVQFLDEDGEIKFYGKVRLYNEKRKTGEEPNEVEKRVKRMKVNSPLYPRE